MIDLLRQYPPATQWFSSLRGEIVGLPGFVQFELMAGCENSWAMQQLRKRLRLFPVYWPTQRDYNRAVATFARGYLSHNLGIFDALIGHSALGLNAVLCTFNVRHYRAIEGLTTEQPYERV